MFDWLGDIISGMGDAIGNAFTGISDSIIDAILNRFIQWLFKSIYDGIANFFTQISNMGTEIFDLSWVQAVVKLFSLFGWSLFVVGVVVSAFDLAIEPAEQILKQLHLIGLKVLWQFLYLRLRQLSYTNFVFLCKIHLLKTW